jgi:RNA polymerase sigma-70 factor (ECF subfamily)
MRHAPTTRDAWEEALALIRYLLTVAPRGTALPALAVCGADGKCSERGGQALRVEFSASVSVERGGSAGPDSQDRVARWIARAQDGDPKAFDRLMQHHLSLCYHVAFRKTGDSDAAVESCQEAMLSAWRRIDSFSGGPKAFRSWLLKIVVNACIDRLRYESRRPSTVSLDAEADDGPRLEPPAQPGPSVERLAETGDVRDRLRRAVEDVPEPYRTTLELHLSEFTYAEIANVLGVDVGTVSSRLSRARGHLRAGMVGQSPGETHGEGSGARSRGSRAPDVRSEAGRASVEPGSFGE